MMMIQGQVVQSGIDISAFDLGRSVQVVIFIYLFF